MRKKQPSYQLPIYIFCGLLLSGVLITYLLTLQEGEKEPEVKREKYIAKPVKVKDPDAIKRIERKAEQFANVLKQQKEEQESYYELFENPASVFTELEHMPELLAKEQLTRKKITVTKTFNQTDQVSEIAGPPKVVIIIDDMGISPKWSKAIADLPGPLTLSYLPYAEGLQSQANYARKNQHHLMLHMPMEAKGGKMSSTPGLLKADADAYDFMELFYKNLNSFEGFHGVNNHMGSRLTQDREKMALVMAALSEQDLYFIDSKTIHSSVVSEIAEEARLPYLVRDVFLDHEENIDFVRNALLQLERRAYQYNYAIAIGHPKKETYKALREWLPTLEEKGIQLIHAGDLIEEKYPLIQTKPFKRKALSATLLSKSDAILAVDHKADQEAVDLHE